MAFEFAITEDGSLSIRDPKTGELHHNRAGAYAEALVNYIEPASVLSAPVSANAELKVLDVCFGLGYNTLVLLSELASLEHIPYRQIQVVAIELDGAVLQLLPQVLEFDRFWRLKEALKDGPSFTSFGDVSFALAPDCRVVVRLLEEDVRLAVPRLMTAGAQFDLVFHDPFSARHQPELWTEELFSCYRRMLQQKRGMLLTYSAAAAVRGGLAEAGFHLFASTGLGGKSGGTVALIDPESGDNRYVFALTPVELAKINSSSGVPYRDPSFSRSRQELLAQRLAEQADWKRTHKL